METHVEGIAARVKSAEDNYREEHAKLQSKYVGKVNQFNLEIQLYMSGILQQICESVGVKYTPGAGHDVSLVTHTLPLGVAYLIHTPPEDEAAAIQSPGKDRLN
jgi:hypothetical protein